MAGACYTLSSRVDIRTGTVISVGTAGNGRRGWSRQAYLRAAYIRGGLLYAPAANLRERAAILGASADYRGDGTPGLPLRVRCRRVARGRLALGALFRKGVRYPV